ncbi:endocuticle structural glycoprotein SgAbd-2-like [Ischnura elegans]|uniref:endocuticle structural glycoprotein SgAbd-2-like n=1 Tax=Ischnura elegans TaxID=197161 RepID=UPI001ED8BFAF|nr:endocuticle structural glycoprotein SgAbd-2-like [Ischnura elegans]
MKTVLALIFVIGCAAAQYRPVPVIGRYRPPVAPAPVPIPIAAPVPAPAPVPIAYKQPYNPPIAIVRQAQDVSFDGTFQYSYETANGIIVEQSGYLKNAGLKDQEAQVVQGSYSYPGPDGQLLTVRYYADETGFHAEGDHLPKPVQAIYRRA